MAIIVRIGRDSMEAVVEMELQTGESPDANAIRRALAEAGVVYGIDEAAFQELGNSITSVTPDQLITRTVARGTAPIAGDDGKIEIAVEFHRSDVGVQGDFGRIDFHERGSFTSIEKSGLIARVVAPTAGVPGKDVRGTEIKAAPGKPAHLKPGKNTRLEANGTELRATASGDLRLNGHVIEVLDMIRIPGNLDYAVGSIDCEGPVRVEGDVLPGFHIHAGGDVWIGGLVESAEVNTRGSVNVVQGVLGGSRIQAGGRIAVGYIREGYLESSGNITIGRESINSTLVSGDSIKIPPTGRVVGGRLLARNTIEVGAAHYAQGRPTVLAVGVNPLKEFEAVRLKAAIHRADNLEKRLGRIKNFLSTEARNEVLDHVLQRAAQKREGNANRLAEIPANNPELASCRIHVQREIHAGIRIQIGTSELLVRQDGRAATFSYDGPSGQVVQT